MDKIFGYEWDDIQAAQQKRGSLQKTIDISSATGRPPATDADRELLAKHGIDGLKEMGFFGVIDRLDCNE